MISIYRAVYKILYIVYSTVTREKEREIRRISRAMRRSFDLLLTDRQTNFSLVLASIKRTSIRNVPPRSPLSARLSREVSSLSNLPIRPPYRIASTIPCILKCITVIFASFLFYPFFLGKKKNGTLRS